MSISKGSLKRVSSASASNNTTNIHTGFTASYQNLPLSALTTNALSVDSTPSTDLLDAIQRWGILEPLIVRALDGEKFEVISGVKRLNACRKIGLHEVPCRILGVLTDSEALSIREALQPDRRMNPLHQTKFIAVSRISSTLPDHLL